MKVRQPLRPGTTWAFKESSGDRDLCMSCYNKDLQGSCPRLSLKKSQQSRLIAVRCTFHSATEDSD